MSNAYNVGASAHSYYLKQPAVRGQALAGVACRRRQKKYESPQSTPVAAPAPRFRAIAHREVGDER